ncbi:Hypothetical protein NTJ_10841 [Nesidiocoris tenuis]|uniref:Gustatory receptor n=1 Tax=Nesidiocoris tenuis TaxID=355587 RepID=A0ABN7B4E1_9HEMI|nr:Hypothetical protein NTJ_10841 [Nesidiocoris tenuis]
MFIGRWMEVGRHCILKLAIIMHCVVVRKRRNHFLIIEDLLSLEEFSNISSTWFVLGLVFYVGRVSTIFWANLHCGYYMDLVVTLNFLFSHLAEFLIVLQYCTILCALRIVVSSVNDNLTSPRCQVDLLDEALLLCGTVNDLYGRQIVLVVGQVFAIVLSYSYDFIDLVTCGGPDGKCGEFHFLPCIFEVKYQLFMYQFVNISSALHVLLLIVRCCGSVVSEVR